MSVNLDKEPDLTPALINELGVRHVLVRFPLADMENMDRYLSFIKSLECDSVLLNVMQDPDHIKDFSLLESQFKTVFTRFSPYVTRFQIGTTINRAKWGFFSVNDFLRFYKVAYTIKKKEFHEIKLLGPSVIDFEYHFLVHALFNPFALKYDAVSALLYVDRRGAPENTQMGFNLISKIHLLYALATLSPKSSNEVYITETNWPISNTAPYAPTSEAECVSVDLYASYMVRYYLQSLCSNMIKAVYWHQLIAPGLGLIDNRGNKIHKYPAFQAYQIMLAQVQDAQILAYIEHKSFFEVIIDKEDKITHIFWCNGDSYALDFDVPMHITSQYGQTHIAQTLMINDAVSYCTQA